MSSMSGLWCNMMVLTMPLKPSSVCLSMHNEVLGLRKRVHDLARHLEHGGVGEVVRLIDPAGTS